MLPHQLLMADRRGRATDRCWATDSASPAGIVEAGPDFGSLTGLVRALDDERRRSRERPSEAELGYNTIYTKSARARVLHIRGGAQERIPGFHDRFVTVVNGAEIDARQAEFACGNVAIRATLNPWLTYEPEATK
jgi:hypothetical protein